MVYAPQVSEPPQLDDWLADVDKAAIQTASKPTAPTNSPSADPANLSGPEAHSTAKFLSWSGPERVALETVRPEHVGATDLSAPLPEPTPIASPEQIEVLPAQPVPAELPEVHLFSTAPALTPDPSPNVGRGESDSLPSELGEGPGMGATKTLNTYSEIDVIETPQPPQPSPPPRPESVSQGIEILGSTVFDPTDFAPILDTATAQPSLSELQAIADAVTQLYLNEGYLTSRAILEQPQAGEQPKIRVIEGQVEEIRITGHQRVRSSYIRRRIALGAQAPVNSAQLEAQLRLLRIDPLFETVEASLQQGSQVGQSIVVVRVTEANPWTGDVSIANDAPPSVGSERLRVSAGHRNLTGRGDTLSAAYNRTTTGGLETGRVAYDIPFNAMNGTVSLSAEFNRTEVTQAPFDVFDIEGDSERFDLSVRQPLVRSPREEFALSAGFSFYDGQTFIFDQPTPFGLGPDVDGVSRTSVMRFGQEYIRRDSGGAWLLASQFRLGTGLFNATRNSGNTPDGQFFSWLGQVQRVQQLSKNHQLIAQLNLQLTPSGLLSSEQFVVGGPRSVRGYRQNARSGDNGVQFSLEDQITLQRDASGRPTLKLAPFVDVGAVWDAADNPNPSPDEALLLGMGLGLAWEPSRNVNLRVDYGLPLVQISDRGDNLQDDGIYFRVGYRF